MAERYFRSKRTGAVKSQSEIYAEALSKDPQYRAQSPDQLGELYMHNPNFEEVRTLPGFGRNVVESAGKFTKDTLSAITSPIQTSKDIANTVLGTISKMSGAGEATERASGANPYAFQESHATALADHFTKRYGGWENIKRTMYEDPVGFTSDIASVLSIGGAGLKMTGAGAKAVGASRVGGALAKTGEVVSKTSDFVDPLTAPTKVLRATGAGKKLGQRIYEGAVQPSGRHLSDIDAQIAAGLKNEIEVSREGLQKVKNLIGQNTSQIDNIITQADTAGYTIDPDAVRVKIDEMIADYRKGSFPEGNIDDLLELKSQFERHHAPIDPATGLRQRLTFKEATDMMRENYRDIERVKDPYGGSRKPISTEAQKAVNQIVLDEMVRELENGPVASLRPLGQERRRLGLEQNALIPLRDDIEQSLIAQRGKPLVRDVVGAGSAARAATGQVTPFGVAALTRSILEPPKRASRVGLDLQKRTGKPSKIRPVMNIMATQQRTPEPPIMQVEIEQIDPFR